MTPLRRIFLVIVPALVFTAFVGAFTVKAIRAPFYNFDVIGYVATALCMEGKNGQELLDATRAELELGIHDDVKRPYMLRGNSPTHVAVMSDPRALEQQLPFYKPRALYVASVSILHRLGLEYVAATVWMSALPLALFAALAWWVLFRESNAWLATILACAGYWGLGLPWLASLSTPDGLALLFSIAGSLALVSARAGGRELVLSSVCLSLSVATRHDLLLHVVMFAPIAIHLTRRDRPVLERIRALLVVIVPAVLVYAVIAANSGWYGRTTVMVFAFVSSMPYPADGPLPDVHPYYVDTLKMNLSRFVTKPWAYREVWPVGFAALAWAFSGKLMRGLMVACVLEIAARFVIFPVAGPGWQRVYMTSIVLTLMFALISLMRRFAKRPQNAEFGVGAAPPAPVQ